MGMVIPMLLARSTKSKNFFYIYELIVHLATKLANKSEKRVLLRVHVHVGYVISHNADDIGKAVKRGCKLASSNLNHHVCSAIDIVSSL